MDILVPIVILLLALLASLVASARSYFEKGRVKGVEQAIREVTKGARLHFTNGESKIPTKVAKSISSLRTFLDSNTKAANEPPLWAFGDAVGESCWRKGYDAGIKVGARPDDKIRLEISVAEMQQLAWLSHLGFQHMMPNYRGFDVHRFSGAEDAREAARSVSLLECALPKAERPFNDIKSQVKNREKLIADWWVALPERKSA